MQLISMSSTRRVHTEKKQYVSYFIFFGSLFFTVALWIATLGDYSFICTDPFLFLSKLVVLPAIVAFSWTFILASRALWLSSLLGGLENMYRLHKSVGIATFSLVVAHVVFQIMRKVPDLHAMFGLFLPRSGWATYAGVLAFTLFILLMALTLWIRIPYHLWKRSHELFIIVLVFSFVHIFLLDKHVNSSTVLSIWIYGFMLAAFISYLYIRVLYYYIGPKTLCTVKKIERLRKTWNVYLEPEQPFSYSPGQFVYISFDNDLLGKELHPYSFSSNPTQPYLRFSIKELGDYTSRMHYLHVGDKATIWGPYGTFQEKYLYKKQDAVFIAGGIGITPFLSMLGYEAEHPRDRHTYVYYCVKEAARADFDDEIAAYAERNPNIHLITHCTSSYGFLQMKDLQELPGGLANKIFFICGPPRMMNSFAKQLHRLGVANRNIIMEQFDLLG